MQNFVGHVKEDFEDNPMNNMFDTGAALHMCPFRLGEHFPPDRYDARGDICFRRGRQGLRTTSDSTDAQGQPRMLLHGDPLGLRRDRPALVLLPTSATRIWVHHGQEQHADSPRRPPPTFERTTRTSLLHRAQGLLRQRFRTTMCVSSTVLRSASDGVPNLHQVNNEKSSRKKHRLQVLR